MNKNRFVIYWNMRQTVIWDTQEQQQVTGKDIYQYLQKIEGDKK